MDYHPAQIILFRHAEKPAEGPELNKQGMRLAHALPLLFSTNEAIIKYGAPVALYAAGPHKPGSSIRSIQTMIPLATSLNLELNQTFNRYEAQAMVKNIFENPHSAGRTIVVCWSHEGIPEMAKFFGAIDIPSKWNPEIFNRIWVLRFEGSQLKIFMDLPQLILPEDHF